jgi:hypothetical protein
MRNSIPTMLQDPSAMAAQIDKNADLTLGPICQTDFPTVFNEANVKFLASPGRHVFRC